MGKKQTVVWTASRSLTESQQDDLLQAGWHYIHRPFITLEIVTDVIKLKCEVPQVILFISKKAVDGYLWQRSHQIIQDTNAFVIAISQPTADYIEEKMAIRPQLVGEGQTAQQMFRWLHENNLLENFEHLLVPISRQSAGKYASLANQYFSKVILEEWIVYSNQRTTATTAAIRSTYRQLKSNDMMVFASPSAWNNWFSVIESDNLPINLLLKDINILAIGPVTAAAIEYDGFNVSHLAQHFSFDVIVNLIVNLRRREKE